MFEPGQDQATGLRTLLRRPPLRLLPVLAAGPVGGAEVLASELAGAFHGGGYRTLLVDGFPGDRGRGSGASSPGAPQRVPVPVRLQGVDGSASAPAWFQELLIEHRAADLAVVCAPEALAGPMLARFDPETLVLCGPAEEDLADAYALLKRLSRTHAFGRFRVLFMGLADAELAKRRLRRLAAVALRHLAVEVQPACGPLAAAPQAATDPRHRTGAGGDLAGIVESARSWRLASIGGVALAVH